MPKNKIISATAIVLIISFIVIVIVLPTTNTHNAVEQSILSTQKKNDAVNQLVSDNTNNEYIDESGKTIIKEALPKTLKEVEQTIATINSGLDTDLPELKKQKEQLLNDTADADALKVEAENILKLAEKDGADNQKIEAQFRSDLDAPITAKKSLALKTELISLDKDVIAIEDTMNKLGILGENEEEANNEDIR